jgi:hypothetical protein
VVADRRYYRPTRRGAEAEYASRWERVRPLLRGATDDAAEPGESASPGPDEPR